MNAIYDYSLTGPRAWTIFPDVLPSKSFTSQPGPAQNATIVCAYADLSFVKESMPFRPS